VPGEPERRYTANDLAADAAAAGTVVSTRLIIDWVSRGLLDRPHRRGLGRGKGTLATWPESQRKLFLVLLEKQRQGVKRLTTLCNVPVTLWLDSEGLDRDYVPLRQARRSLATWATASRAGPVRAARHTAEQLIEQQGMPHISHRARRALIDAIVTASGGGQLDLDLLYDAARQAFTSERFAALWVRTIEARFAAIDGLDEIDDQTFETARMMVNQTSAIYGDQRLAGATNDEERRQRAIELINELSNNACLGLLTALGILELARLGPAIPDKSAPRPLQRPGATARGAHTPHADEHAAARRRVDRGSPQRASAS
jgi:hypothetical protein